MCARRRTVYLLDGLSSFCHCSCPFSVTLSYHSTRLPGTRSCIWSVRYRRNKGVFRTATSCKSTRRCEEPRTVQDVKGNGCRQKAGLNTNPRDSGGLLRCIVFCFRVTMVKSQRNVTHTQGVLDVNEPAVEAVGVADLDQSVGNGPVRFLVFEESLAGHGPLTPLRDESTLVPQRARETTVNSLRQIIKWGEYTSEMRIRFSFFYIYICLFCSPRTRTPCR